MKAPRISILMAVYNCEAYLPRALDSLLNQQDVADVEVICVDDCSTDGSRDVLAHYASMDTRVKVLLQPENQGQAVARNRALTVASGEFVAMVDADDWLSPDALTQALRCFEAHPQTDCVVFRLQRVYDDGKGGYRYEDYPSPFTPNVSLVTPSPFSLETPAPISLESPTPISLESPTPISLEPPAPFSLDTLSLSGLEAMRLALDWRLHGLYVTRMELHRRFPYDTSCRLYSDDNTTLLHYLHSREVRFCPGTYYWYQHPESTTHTINVNYFLHIRANQSMLAALVASGVSQEIIALYEQHRRHVFDGQYFVFCNHRMEFTPTEQRFLWSEFQSVYTTLGYRLPFTIYKIRKSIRFFLGRVKRRII